MALTLRNLKGSELTWSEVDTNFIYLDGKIDTNIVNPDWSATDGYAQILNKPTTLGGYGITDGVGLTSTAPAVSYALGESVQSLGTITNTVSTQRLWLGTEIKSIYYGTMSAGITCNFVFGSLPTYANQQCYSFMFELKNGGSATVVNWPLSVKWAGGTKPTLTSAGVDILGFYSYDGGITWRGVLLSKDSK